MEIGRPRFEECVFKILTFTKKNDSPKSSFSAFFCYMSINDYYKEM
jgi:hypothetical protein